MKRYFLTFVALAVIFLPLNAQEQKIKYVDATKLTILGKAFYDTPNPYHRVDTEKYKGFTDNEKYILHCSPGMSIVFRTDSKNIQTATHWGYIYAGSSTARTSSKGYDLYIKDKDGKWVFAACNSTTKYKKGQEEPDIIKLVQNMDGSMHECLIHFASYSEVLSLKIGVDEDATIEAVKSPFRHCILFHGSSFTHGVSTSRPGMSYPLQFQRRTGLEIIGLGMSGRSRLQSYMIPVLADIEADAYVFDTFSNPDSATICRRLMPFIDGLIEAHPGKPLIFQRTIYREHRNFNVEKDALEKAKAEAVEKMFAQILGNPKYKVVYLITPNASFDNETSVDGTHPDNYGYYLWEQSIEQPILDILGKYGIK